MKIYGELIKARIEQIAGTISGIAKGLLSYNTTNDKPYIDTGAGAGFGAKEIMVREELSGEASGPYTTAKPILPIEGGTGLVASDFVPANNGRVLAINESTNTFDFIEAGGGGGLDSWLTESFETTVAGDFSTGNSATFLGGGALSGVLSDEIVTPISKDSSIKFVAGAASLNDYFASPTIDVNPKQQENDSGITFYFTWDGTTDIECVVWDETNSSKLNSILDVVNTADSATRYSATFYPPATCTQVRYGFHFLVAPTSGDILILDDVEFSTDPFQYKELIDTESARYYNGAGYGSTNTRVPYYSNEITDNTGSIVSVDNSSTLGFSITAKKRCTISGVFSTTGSLVSNIGCAWTLNGTELSTNVTNITNSQDLVGGINYTHDNGANSGITSQASMTVDLVAGDILRPQTNGSAVWNAPIEHITITAQATTEHVVTPSTSVTEVLAGNGVTAKPSNKIQFTTITDDTISQLGTYVNDGTDGMTYTASVAQYIDINASGRDTGNSDNNISILRNGIIVDSEDTGGGLTSGVFRGHSTGFSGKLSAGDTIWVGSSTTANAWFSMTVTSADLKLLSAVPIQKVAYLKEFKTSGSNSGNTVADTVHTRDLTNIEGDSEIVSLSTNQFTLAKGKYIINALAPAYDHGRTQIFLYNVTDSVYEIDGVSGNTDATGNVYYNATLEGSITISSSKTYEVRHWAETSRTGGLGISADTLPGNPQSNEVYTTVKITKLR